MDSPADLWEWDWYGATLPDSLGMSGVEILAPLGDEPPKRSPGLYGYSRGWEIRREGQTFARVFESDTRPDYAVASGQSAPRFVHAIRATAPGHSVSRADVKRDFLGGVEAFLEVRQTAYGVLGGKVTLTDLVEHGLDQDARTLYIGKRKSSEAFGRLYQSGLVHDYLPPDANRLEIELKPAKAERKSHLATLSPGQAVGWARWTRELLEHLGALVEAAAPPRVAALSDHDRTMNAMCSQYGRHLWEHVARHQGDLEAAYLDLLDRTNGDPHGAV